MDVPLGYPPDAAHAVDGTYYRLSRKDHAVGDLTDRDSWLRPFETRGSARYGQADIVEAHGLSIRSSLEALERDRDLSPWMAKKSVAEVSIGIADGWVQHTPEQGDGHHDWWTAPPGLVPRAVVILEGRAA